MKHPAAAGRGDDASDGRRGSAGRAQATAAVAPAPVALREPPPSGASAGPARAHNRGGAGSAKLYAPSDDAEAIDVAPEAQAPPPARRRRFGSSGGNSSSSSRSSSSGAAGAHGTSRFAARQLTFSSPAAKLEHAVLGTAAFVILMSGVFVAVDADVAGMAAGCFLAALAGCCVGLGCCCGAASITLGWVAQTENPRKYAAGLPLFIGAYCRACHTLPPTW